MSPNLDTGNRFPNGGPFEIHLPQVVRQDRGCGTAPAFSTAVYLHETPMRYWLACLFLAGCDPGSFAGIINLAPPTHLTYTVEPSGKPGDPAGVILRWDHATDPNVDGWNVYEYDKARTEAALMDFLRGGYKKQEVRTVAGCF